MTLEVVDLRGHTPGSIGLLDKEARLLYSGDGLNPHLWMQLEHSLPLTELKTMLTALKAQHGQDFDGVLTGHDQGVRGAEIVDLLLIGCEEILAGYTEKDQRHHFSETSRQHPIADVPGVVIVYSQHHVRP